MAEYIDREAAIAKIEDRAMLRLHKHDTLSYQQMKLVKWDIEDIPAADVVARDCYDKLLAENDELRKVRPVQHGRWSEKMFRGLPLYECSACGISNPWGKTFYCPTCGADMRGES